MRLKHFYVDDALNAGPLNIPTALSHRLAKVLRLGAGAPLAVFNGTDGLWAATVADVKATRLNLTHQLAPQPAAPTGLTLAVGLPKREAWESALRQATELGVATIQPLLTDYTVAPKLNLTKAHAQAIEAAEQCERLTLPTLCPPLKLAAWLAAQTTPVAWAYERGTAVNNALLRTCTTVLVGPEGGFSPAEVELLSHHPHVVPFTLPTPILRTDTAVVAALVAVSLVS
jgi:16S rRNA (uracil1498-N3)-methyltransferase